ncbi:MAG: hypothetical protein Q6370_003715, partial [Candidatus Sigynarchaeota archaeon]
EEAEDGDEAEEGEEAEDGDEAEEGEEAEEADEVEDADEGDEFRHKKKKSEKKPVAKKNTTKTTKASKPAKEIALEKDDLELYELIKSKGDEGIIQMNIKDESKLPPSKISKIILKLKNAGLIVKENTKIKDAKGKSIVTNLIKAVKK